MSDITEEGHGDKHDWEDKGTERIISPVEWRSTLWECRKCSVHFRHYYHVIPNIFEAMKERGVELECLTK